MGIARKEKIHKFSPEAMADEIGDVLITTMLLAKAANIDPQKALTDKIKKIPQKFSDLK